MQVWNTALGFYQNEHTAKSVLRKLRQKGFIYSLSIQRTHEDKIKANLLGWGIFLFGLVSLMLLLFLFFLIPHFDILPSFLFGVLILTFGGWFFYLFQIKMKVFNRYKDCILKGEVLIVVFLCESQVRKVLSLLREGESDHPITFLLKTDLDYRNNEPEDNVKEALTIDQLQECAVELAGYCKAISFKKVKGHHLLDRLHQSGHILEEVRHNAIDAEHIEQTLTLSAEWLLDNTHVIQENLKEVFTRLPLEYYFQLPKLLKGPWIGLPRIYAIAANIVDSTAYRLNHDNIVTFLKSYMSVDFLTIGELWALPLILRLALLERLQTLAMHLNRRLRDGELARFWGNRLLNISKMEPERLNNLFGDIKKLIPIPSACFAEELIENLYDEEAVLNIVKTWTEETHGSKINQIMQSEQIQEATDELAFSSAVTSLSALSQLSWRDIFECVSPVDEVLKMDPALAYAEMDFSTRDLYRHSVEKMARLSNLSEIQVAKAAIDLANEGVDDITNHVGYYLIDDGQPILENTINMVPTWSLKIHKWMRDYSTQFFLGTIFIAVALMEFCLFYLMNYVGASWGEILLFLPLSLLPVSELAVQFVNLFVPLLIPPHILPKMGYEKGIPEACKTLVIIPALLSSKNAIEDVFSQVETHYLTNQDPQLKFGILFDFTDAITETTKEDESLLQIALIAIENLQNKYGNGIFFLFLRDRIFSESESAWIGWERKRGKLECLNRFLTDPTSSRTLLRFGNPEELNHIRFVITLDEDTELPKDKARHLIATLSHPLNIPHLNADHTLRRGYTIIQPRVSTALSKARHTWFAKIFSDVVGLDPYTQAISDVYQDLMREGTYHGKCIYDVQAFNRILSDRFPEEQLLSHDLIEGALVGVGHASDVALFDQFPQDYLSWCKRQHRWIRGDWQNIGWLFPYVKDANHKIRLNPLSAVNRWKIFDNIRRALLMPALFTLLIGAWFISSQPALWTMLVGVILFIPACIVLVDSLTSLSIASLTGNQIVNAVVKALITASLIPHQAFLSADALCRVIYRRFVSKKNLLEWSTAKQSSSPFVHKKFISQLCVIPLFASPLLVMVYFLHPVAFFLALPFCVLWALSPLVVAVLDNQNLVKERYEKEISTEDRLLIRKIARKTWRYFDDFVGDGNHWLPPDNYQAAINVEVAQRTSPTNIGLYLLAVVSAYDLKYLSGEDVIERLSKAFKSLTKLELYEGHFLNWYDITVLKPLYPRYVSTVDNGNLLASLWTLEQAFYQLSTHPILPLSFLEGFEDTLALFCERINSRYSHEIWFKLKHSLNIHPKNISQISKLIKILKVIINDGVKGLEEPEQVYWLTCLQKLISSWEHCFQLYFSWVELANQIPEEATQKISLEVERLLHMSPTLQDLSVGTPFIRINKRIDEVTDASPELNKWINRLREAFHQSQWFAAERIDQIQSLVNQATEISKSTNMQFLYNKDRKLFSIGYHVEDCKLDNCFYDLLASEARIASLIGIGKGEIPIDHWWSLGRPYRVVNGTKVLVSWGGTMFEYLMPLLFTHHYEGSLLGNACENAVVCQIQYGKKRGFPWGVSEAAFSEIDARGTYQYRSFGVPGLGFKRDLEKDLVVSPYSTGLALIIDPIAALRNLRSLNEGTQNLYGSHGYYESIDFAREYGPHGERGIIVYAYMAHHQGMFLIGANNLLNKNIMPKRFHADPRVKGVESLLYERIPTHPNYTVGYRREIPLTHLTPFNAIQAMGILDTPHTSTPRVNLLANNTYSVMVTNTGGGYSKWLDFDITRWRADTTNDAWGSFCYIKDMQSGKIWSSTFQPTYSKGQKFSVHFKTDKAEFKRRDNLIETKTEIAVSPQDNVEVRLITLANLSKSTCYLELTSYSELALAPHKVDLSHPCFNKLFIQTESFPALKGLLAFRRLRSKEDIPLYAAHVVSSDQPNVDPFEFETDRSLFIGRGRTLASPQGVLSQLSNSEGFVLDPIFSIRHKVVIKPGQRVQVSFITAIGDNRDSVLELMKKYSDISATHRVLDLAWTYAQLDLRHLRIHQEEAQLFQKLASYILFPQPQLRLSTERLYKNRLGQSRLWVYGISGDLPILAVTIANIHELDIVKQVLSAHAFWRQRGLKVDLVILNEEATSYEHPLHERLNRLINAQSYGSEIGKPGGIYLLNCDQIPEEDILLILACARANLIAARGFLRQHLVSHIEANPYSSRLVVNKEIHESPSSLLPFMELPYFNGLGGFTQDGKEYVIYLGPNANTPAPWSNVIANTQFGTLITESGLGTSWFGNSQTYRLTPWSNDPLLNPIGDLIYIRDDETGNFWTPTPAPIREDDAFRIKHGQGYSYFEHNSHGIEQNLLVFVPIDEAESLPMRIQAIELVNATQRKRTLSLFGYTDLVLGTEREQTQMHIVTEWDPESQSIFAYNYYNSDFCSRVAFVSSSQIPTSYTCNRKEFLGRNHPLSNPAVLKRKTLSGYSGAGVDPCAALHVYVELDPGEKKRITFVLGSAASQEEARKLALLCRDEKWVDQMLGSTKQWWESRLETIQVECPELFISFSMNRWLLYQTLSCRILARTGFYQSSGAYGFRDQLQDVLALVYCDPQIARDQILRAASRQFIEGDVQHWWLPPSNAGVRTRISDDMLWLVFVTAQYVRVTKDVSILDEGIPFIKGELLKEGQEDLFFIPEISTEIGTLLEHCRRAIKKCSSFGIHGLPLIGCGDWNDGMNLVGIDGKGESVWLGWFLIHVMNDFAFLLNEMGQPESGKGYQEESKRLAEVIELKSWDGEWYRRAYFDDETPLGSQSQQECKVDSLAQTWAIISDAGRQDRREIALKSIEKYLIKEKDGLVLLLYPPFDKMKPDPGYIKGYPPGVRENGGQYTHGSLWVPLAFTRMGEGDKAFELLKMMHPVMHTQDMESVGRYKIEPYVTAGDVYSLEGKMGRGGWSWYTGSPSWMYRIWLEEIFGFKLRGTILKFEPTFPKHWPSVKLSYKFRNTPYYIVIENLDHLNRGDISIELDGSHLDHNEVQLVDDGLSHQIKVMIRMIHAE